MTLPSRGIHGDDATLEDYNGRVAIWKFDDGSGYGIYLYENNWEIEDDWLLWKFKRDENGAREIFDKVVDAL